MLNILQNIRIVRRNRYHQLKQRERGHFDLRFLRDLPHAAQAAALNALPKSQSQIRQDIFALATNEFRRDGFFVEFGAGDGVDLSNTNLLETGYGWSGILAEPAKSLHTALRANRSSTIETRCVWSASGDMLSFTETQNSHLSAISPFVNNEHRKGAQDYQVETVSLNDLLLQHKAPAIIDYMSIDTEGSEFEILNAFDFDRWQMRCLSVEHNHSPQREQLFTLLSARGYRRVMIEHSGVDDWYVKDI